MSNYVNKIKKDGVEYDIHDKRIDDAQSGTIADVFGLDSEGNLVKGAAGGGGTKLYLHEIKLGNIPTGPDERSTFGFISLKPTPATSLDSVEAIATSAVCNAYISRWFYYSKKRAYFSFRLRTTFIKNLYCVLLCI